MLIDLTCGYVPLDEIEFDLEMLKIPAVVRAWTVVEVKSLVVPAWDLPPLLDPIQKRPPVSVSKVEVRNM